jgi:hypothetical protein
MKANIHAASIWVAASGQPDSNNSVNASSMRDLVECRRVVRLEPVL